MGNYILRIEKNVWHHFIYIQIVPSNNVHIDAHVVRMRSDCRNLRRSRCSVLEHGEEHERSVVRRELKREKIYF